MNDVLKLIRKGIRAYDEGQGNSLPSENLLVVECYMFRQWARLLGLSGVVLLSSPAAVLAKEREKQGKTVSYIWGNGVYQARPDALLQFRNFEPKRITTLTGDKSMRMLRFSEYYEAGIDTQGRLYVWPIKPLDSNAGDNKD